MTWNSRPRPRRWPVLAFMVALAAAVAGCGAADDAGLDPYVCQQADVGGDFQELTRGNFSPRDLADLGPHSDQRERDFRDAGMGRGRFAFFKQSLPKPPFDPPVNVVCQVLEFRDPLAASRWVLELTDEDIRHGVLVSWLPAELETTGFIEYGSDSRAWAFRAYHVEGVSSAGTTYADVFVRARGNVVSLVASGRTADRLYPSDYSEGAVIQDALFKRLDAEPPAP